MASAIDGEPLPIVGHCVAGVDHPTLYSLFMYVAAAERTMGVAGAVLNALCEQLVVSTMHRGQRYRAVFSQGAIVTLLSPATCVTPLGTNWLTFRPDVAVIASVSTVTEAKGVCERTTTNAVTVSFEDHTTEDADWH